VHGGRNQNENRPPDHDADTRRDEPDTAGRTGRRWGPRTSRRDAQDRVILYGWHTVKAAIENPRRRIRHLLLTENAARRLQQQAIALPPATEVVRPEIIAARLTPDAVHQGLMAEADPLPALDLEDVAPEGIFLVLDQITDPHNVGAVIRSAAAFAASAVITTLRHSPEATGVLAKAASGALEHVPIVSVPNLARALDTLKSKGVLLVGLDSGGALDLAAAPLRMPLGLVLGAEDKGMRQLTRSSCDLVAQLALPGPIGSLNVSNAAALALHVAASRVGALNGTAAARS
jgi:23S rRNA (guanosine2251-2'-O)-methyltransferase